MKILYFLVAFVTCSCQCKYYSKYTEQDAREPISTIGARHVLSPCIGEERITVGVRTTKREYAITADSTAYGHIANIMYIDRDPFVDTIVGAGSEFDVGRCRFRVLKVYPPNYKDTIYNKVYLYDLIGVQTISFPKKCRCANKALQAFEEEKMDSTWEQRYFDR